MYCWSFASEKSLTYTFSTLIKDIKKIIIQRNAIFTSIFTELCLSDKENMDEAINSRENKTIVKELPFNISKNSLLISPKKFLIIWAHRSND